VVLIFIYPGVTKKTKINAHELEALRFFLTCYELSENAQLSGAGQGGQGRAGGKAGCCGWLRACTHAPCEHQLLAVRRADERRGHVDF